jgi:S-adenosylmethionine decarboxylase
LSQTQTAPVASLSFPPNFLTALEHPQLTLEHPTVDTDFLGQHIVVSFEQADPDLLASCAYIETHLTQAAIAAGVTIVTRHFQPIDQHNGVSGALILAESHFTIHTNPQQGSATLDLFTCGGHTHPKIAFQMLIEALRPKVVRYQEYRRGFLNASQQLFHSPAMLVDEANPLLPEVLVA